MNPVDDNFSELVEMAKLGIKAEENGKENKHD